MKDLPLSILRIGLGITFLWIGVLIFQDPLGWGGYLQPWAADLMPIPIKTLMIFTAVLDITVGVFLIINVLTWFHASLGAAHLTIVLITSGITALTVRDIGLLAGALALAVSVWPDKFKRFGG